MTEITIALLLAQQEPSESGKSLLEHIASGGPIGFVIIGLSFVAVAFIIMHLIQIRQAHLAPPQQVEDLNRLLKAQDIKGAVRYCQMSEYDSFLTRVVGASLVRCSRSSFGLLELRSALEESAQEQVAQLYRSTDGIGLIASVAPMLGLLGTVVGMVGAFDTISTTQGFARPDELAGSISVALITTVMGLIVAIPCTAVFTYFRNRIDHHTARVGGIIEELAVHLEGGPTEARPAGARAPSSAPAPVRGARTS